MWIAACKATLKVTVFKVKITCSGYVFIVHGGQQILLGEKSQDNNPCYVIC